MFQLQAEHRHAAGLIDLRVSTIPGLWTGLDRGLDSGLTPFSVLHVKKRKMVAPSFGFPDLQCRLDLLGTSRIFRVGTYPLTSQNTMYCGGEPEHKRVANKCMREEIHAHNNGK